MQKIIISQQSCIKYPLSQITKLRTKEFLIAAVDSKLPASFTLSDTNFIFQSISLQLDPKSRTNKV